MLASDLALATLGVESHGVRFVVPGGNPSVAVALRGTPYRLNLHIGLVSKRVRVSLPSSLDERRHVFRPLLQRLITNYTAQCRIITS